MMRLTLSKIKRAASAAALVALAAFASGCGGAPNNARQSNAGAQSSPAQSNGDATAASNVDVEKLNADIERLEKSAERNPGDEDTRDELARGYVRRGDAERATGQPQEALKDYQRGGAEERGRHAGAARRRAARGRERRARPAPHHAQRRRRGRQARRDAGREADAQEAVNGKW
jgi:hypothetical protein